MVGIGAFSFDITADTSSATRALAELQRQAAAFNSGGNFTIAPKVNVAPANAAISGLQRTAQQTAAAIEKPITPRVDTKPAESALQRFGQSFAQGLGIGGGAAIAVKGIEALQGALTSSIGAGLQYNAQLETATKTLELFTGSAGQAQEALKILRSYADFTPFNTDEVIRGGQAFIGVVNGDIGAMEKLIHLTGQLAATNPDVSAGGGFEGATRALREVLGGQTTSIADRFNIPLSTIQHFKDLGLTGIDLAEALVKAAHGSEELVTALSTTSTGQLSNFQSALANLGKTATEPLFAELTKTLGELNKELSTNATAWQGWATDVGRVIGQEVATDIAAIKQLVDWITIINKTLADFRAANPLVQMGQEFTDAAASGPVGGLLVGPPRNRTSESPSSEPVTSSLITTPTGMTATATGPTAEQRKAEAEKLGKELKEIDDDATRHALQNLQDDVEATRKRSAEKKQAIEDVRDGAIRAADQSRDAAIRALDDEAQRRSRARTLEDRGIADTNAAILEGLEQTHNASLKGLDEQAAAIDKRRDVAIKGIDEEISAIDRKRDAAIKAIDEEVRTVDRRRDTAVRGIDEEVRAIDRKRDAAIRALDEESRAESRRHSEALRNIDRERDARLGEIDERLKKLDAAAQRDQRRQTDQSLARSLSEARTDLKNADTPAERARALRAVADAEAAISRERRDRQREDARARLQERADQIRDAADQRKEAENLRNTTTTDVLGEQKRGITEAAQAETARLNEVKLGISEVAKAETDRLNETKRGIADVAKADTDRLNETKRRVEEEAKIEAESIQARVKAENEGYQQAVKNQQDAFTQQARALEDQRTAEDASLADRRKAVQDTYEGAAQAAKDSAESQTRALASVTASTIDELDAQKRKWTEWKEHILGEIDQAMKAGDPSKLRQLQTSPDDSTYGPLDPPGYSQDSTYGPFDPAGYRDAAKNVGTDTAAGLAEGIGGPESVAAATTATDKLILEGVIAEAKSLLEITSPSKVFEGFGTDTVQGFLDGYQSLDLVAPIRAPFEASILWMEGVPDHWRIAGEGASTQFLGAYDGAALEPAIRLPFEHAIIWMGGVPDHWRIAGDGASTQFTAAYNGPALERTTIKPFDDALVWMRGLPAQFQGSGASSAAAFGTGWTSRNPGTLIQNSLTTIVQNANSLTSSWATVGGNFATGLANGFNAYLAANPLQVPTGATAGGTSTASGYSAPSGGDLGARGGGMLAYTGQKFGQYDAEAYLVSKGYAPGSAAFNQLFDQLFAYQSKGYSPPPDMTVTGHQFGGFAPKDRMAKFGEGGMELGFPAQAGSILPADVSRNLLAVASGQAVGGGGAAGGTWGDININIDLGGVTVQHEADENRLVDKMSARMQEELGQVLGRGQRFPYGISRTP